ncbi:tetratricopeptide repeat protein [Myxococcus sp. Y35]|uniref:tetratricopeptide repeat protein n=1 Tax=Pseudomyxococcus flavus TaxID=3115648 RepID=UPI003CF0F0A4
MTSVVESETPPYLSPSEIVKQLEASPVRYRVEGKDSPPGGWVDQLWPQRMPSVEVPWVVEENGRRLIREWPVEAEVKALLDEAEPHFQARRYDEAATLYARATERYPNNYVAWVFRGDAAYFAGDAATALEHYRRATTLNPHDHRAWFFQGNALAKLGRFEEALEAWAWCLVLNPRYPVIRQFFRTNAHLGLVIRGDVIVPRGYAERDAEGVSIQFDPNHDPGWFAFANCKALWLGEPSHREKMTGSTEEQFTSVEEMECLASALAVHESQKAEGKMDALDPTLDRLFDIAQEGLLLEVVLFEVGARVHPHVVLTLDDALRQRLKRYVLTHVLVPAGRREG